MLFSLCSIGQLRAETAPGNAQTTGNNIADLTEKSSTYWQEMADGMAQALIKHFWGANFKGYEDRYYFNYGSDLSNMTTNHYWPQAHAMDVLVDAYMRTDAKRYKELFPLWWERASKYNFAGKMNPKDAWWNVFVDDMEWIVLAQIRMFEGIGNAMPVKCMMTGFGRLGDPRMKRLGMAVSPGRLTYQSQRMPVPMVRQL